MQPFTKALEDLLKQYHATPEWVMSEYPEMYADIREGDTVYHLSVQEGNYEQELQDAMDLLNSEPIIGE